MARRFLKLRKAATALSALHRMAKHQSSYNATMFVVGRLQTHARRRIAWRAVERMKDPFGGLTYEELKQQHDNMEQQLEAAIGKKDFEGAAALESTMGDLKAAVEAKRPMTRGLLEKLISEVKNDLESAVEGRRFAECGPLQAKMDELVAKREDLPTLTELDAKVKKFEAEVAEKSKNRDFAGAASAQKMADEWASKLQKARKEEGELGGEKEANAEEIRGENAAVEPGSRAELDVEIEKLSKEVQDAVAKKDFAFADEKQALLGKLESSRATLFTCKQMKEQMAKCKEGLDKCVNEKKFSEASSFQKKLDELEVKYSEEKKKETELGRISEKAPEKKKQKKNAVLTAKGKNKANIKVAGKGGKKLRGVMGNKSVKDKENVATVVVNKDDSSEVRKLRPKKALTANIGDSVLSVCKMMQAKRCDATLIVREEGGLAGIVSDTDIVRRVVAKHLDHGSAIEEVMTPNPTCVEMSDSALDALGTMIDNHFRHLPVLDGGNVVGLLDIAKCLYEAISKLEKMKEKGASGSGDVDAALKASLAGVGGAQAAALAQLLGPLLAKAGGGSGGVPTLRTVLESVKAVIVGPGTNIRDTAIAMADARKAALVVEDEELVGIFTFKDVMNRAVAKEVPLELTAVSSLMTPSPDTLSPDVDVLEALQMMHDNKFLNLPVVEEDGSVLGLVDVMDLITAVGGKDQWREIFSSAMEGGDDISDTSSLHSMGSTTKASKRGGSVKSVSGASKVSKAATSNNSKTTEEETPVSKLRPKKPMIAENSESVLEVCKMMQAKRCDATLIVGEEGGLVGIVSDTDIVRRVVAKHLDHGSAIEEVMTPNPTCVEMSDSALDALGTMIDNHFRHLPVLDGGNVVGLLDIAKCLYEAISKLEKMKEKGASGSGDVDAALKASLAGVGGAQAAALAQLLGPLLAKAGGGSGGVPTLRTVLESVKAVIVGPGTNIRDTAIAMADARKAALVVEDEELVGIFTFKDVMNRAVAKEVPLELTAVSSLMTPSPDTLSPDVDVLEALQMMHDNKFLNLPVVEEDGSVLGLVDVMDLITAVGGKDQWREIFSSAMEGGDDNSDTASLHSMGSTIKSAANSKRPPVGSINIHKYDSRLDSLPDSPGQSEISHLARQVESEFVFKIVDGDGNTHRIKGKAGDISALLCSVVGKLGGTATEDNLRLKFTDDEGDVVVISDNAGLQEAVELQRSAGSQALKLRVETVGNTPKGGGKGAASGLAGDQQNMMIGLAVGGVALLAGLGFMVMKPRK